MPGGDVYELAGSAMASALSNGQRADLRAIVSKAREISGYGFAVYLGPLEAGRETAIEQHAALDSPESAVLVAVDPAARAIEIVTGSSVAVNLDNRSCELAVLSMKSCFQADDMVGGVREGVTLLAEHARHPRVMHLSEPS